MAIEIIDGFSINKNVPIDDRNNVQTLVSRDAINVNFRYPGLKCYVIDLDKEFQLKSGVTNSNWVDITSGVAGVTGATSNVFLQDEINLGISPISGSSNSASGFFSFILNGTGNTASGDYSVVSGVDNSVSGDNSFIYSEDSIIESFNSTILGGLNNKLTSTATGSTILGGTGITGSTADTVYGINFNAEGTISANTIYSGSTDLSEIFELSGSSPFSGNPITGSIIALSGGSIALGTNAFASGQQTIASGSSAHAEGNQTTASGNNGSHSEGQTTTASGERSHAEGLSTTASGDNSHAEGNFTIATGVTSHAQGFNTKAFGFTSHAEGFSTTAIGTQSHAEGNNTTAFGTASHSEGTSTVASGNTSHAGGNSSKAIAQNSFVHSKTSDVEAEDGAILGGELNKLTSTANRSIILGGTGITGSTADTVYGINFNAQGSVSATTFYSGSTNLNDLLGSSDIYENGLYKSDNKVGVGGSIISSTTLSLVSAFTIHMSGTMQDNTSSLIKANFGSDTDESVFSIRNESGNNVSSGLSDIKIGPGNGADIASNGRVFFGQNNLTGLSSNNLNLIAIGNNNFNSFTDQIGYSVAIGFGNQNLVNSQYDTLIGTENLASITASTGDNVMLGVWNGNAARSIGSYNSMIGDYNLYLATDIGSNNSIMGPAGLSIETIGSSNVLLGYDAGTKDVSNNNVILGAATAREIDNTLIAGSDDFNTFIGSSSFRNGNHTSSGTSRTTAIGTSALRHGGGSNNTAIGRQAGWAIDGINNTVVGYRSGRSSDTAFSSAVSNTIFSGANSTFLGVSSGYQSSAASITNTVVLGSYYANEGDTTYLASTGSIKIIPNTTNGVSSTVWTWPTSLGVAGQAIVADNNSGDLSFKDINVFNSGITANTITNVGGKIETLTIITGVTSYSANTSQEMFSVNVSSGITISLPSAPGVGQSFIIKDASGQAVTNNITIDVVDNTYLIDGSFTDVIDEDYASARYVFDGNIYMIL